MYKFKYTVDLSQHLPFGDGKKPIETHTGIVEAPDYLSAKEKAWGPIVKRAKEIEQERGIIVAIGNVQIDRTTEPETITLAELVQRRKQRREIPADTKVICTASDIHNYTVTLLNEVHTEIHAGLTQIWRNPNISKWSEPLDNTAKD